METATNHEPFGTYLHRFRAEQAMSAATIAANTRMTVSSIRAMEANDHDRLPPPPYVKSFIRNYAEAVGADAEKALSLYTADLAQREADRTQQIIRQVRSRALRRVGTAAGILVAIFVLLRCSHVILDPVETQPMSGLDPSLAVRGEVLTDSRPRAGQPHELLKLKVLAVKRTWLKVIIDGQRSRSYQLKPEDRLELEGSHNFNLMVGNAEGVKVSLNDRPVKIFGSSDQAVSLKIP